MKYPSTESVMLELKETLPQNAQFVKTIIGFCNQNGGLLIIGVADDGTIVGVPEKDIELRLESIERFIFDASEPTILPRLSTQRFGDKSIIAIEVSQGMNPPYYLKTAGKEKGTYIRLGKHTTRATLDIIRELEWRSRGYDFESMPVYRATIDDIDMNKFEKFLVSRKNRAKISLSKDTLNAYSLITHEHHKEYPTTLGILLFGRVPQKHFTEAMIICTHFQGTTGREVVATIDCEGNLFNQFKQANAFILDRLYRSFTITSLKRDEQLEIPKVAIREALMNAIIHRNYHIKAPIKIAIYDDRLEFFSPGQFPGPLDTENLTQGISYLRNPMICKILREANYIEKLGSGFINIFESYEKHNLKTPRVIEGDNYIKCILPRISIERNTNLTSTELKLAQLFLQQHEVTVRDVMKQLKMSRSTALRRLNELLQTGEIERIGKTKAVLYRKKNLN